MSFFKKDKPESKNYADADVQTQLARIIEQLGFLERKIDGLSQNRGPRPGGRPGFGRPGGHFREGQSNGGFRPQGGGFRGGRDRDGQNRRPGGRSFGGPRPQRDGGHRSHGPRPQSQGGHQGGPSKDDNFGNV